MVPAGDWRDEGGRGAEGKGQRRRAVQPPPMTWGGAKTTTATTTTTHVNFKIHSVTVKGSL